MTQLVGQRLGRYQVEELIGSGGMASVYRAQDLQLQRNVALKVMAAHLGIDPAFVKRFRREAVLAANLHHPAIVTVYDVGEDRHYYYISMELVRGRSLHTIMRSSGALGLEYAVAILQPLGAALDYAHQQGAVHRDIKPHNVLVDHTGRVLLTDFGIAQPPNAEREGLTRTGVFMGTPEYISPEQAEGRRVDGRSDLYSLGIIVYEILTGSVPFSGNTPQLILAHTQNPPPPLGATGPHLPPELENIIQRALAKRPEDRYQQASELVAALEEVATLRQITPVGPTELAALAIANQSSAGRPTIAVDDGETDQASQPAPPAPLPSAAALAPAASGEMLHSLLKEPTPPEGTATPAARREAIANQPTRQVALPQTSPPARVNNTPPPYTPSTPGSVPGYYRPTPPGGTAARRTQSEGSKRGWATIWAGSFLLIAILAMVAAALFAFVGDRDTSSQPGGGVGPAETPPTAVPVPPTPVTPDVPTATPRPPTATVRPPTAQPTAVPPTATVPVVVPPATDPPPPPLPTNTPPPPPPTDTPQPPTDTPPPPTDTPQPPTATEPADPPRPPTTEPLPPATPTATGFSPYPEP